MPLLAPFFLLGLAAVALPLLVHLVHRERKDPTAFPSLMFLERTPAPFASRRNLRDPLLFLLRALAVIALVLAFARPFFGRETGATGADLRRRDIVVLLDRSFSMRIRDRWPRAQSSADSVIRSLSPGDRLTLVAFDRRARAVTTMTADVEGLRAALKALAPSDEATRFAPAIAVAQQRLAASDAPRKVLVVISDFQRSGWDITDESQLPTGTELATVDVGGVAPVVDRAVRSVDVRVDRRAGPGQMVVSARVTNRGAATRGVRVRLEVGGRPIEERSLDLPRDGGSSVSFAGIAVPPDPVPARVVLAADSLPGDDGYHFLLNRAPELNALVIEGRATPFLTRALSIGDVPRFRVITRTPSRVTGADLVGTRVVILADGAFPTGIGAERLTSFVANGGGLLLALGDAASPRRWPAGARGLLAGALRPVIDRAGTSGAVLGTLDQRHPALAALAGARAGDLAAARFLKYRPIDTTAGVLARFDDGTAALTEHAVGRGRVITFGSTFDGEWNDLPRLPAFLPLVQQLARYAAGWRDAPIALEIGASVRPGDLAGTAGADVTRWVANAPSGARTTTGGSGESAALELIESGVHELRPGGAPGARPVLVAANIAPAELDFTAFDVVRLRNALLGATRQSPAGVVAAEPETRADIEARQSTWWYLLLAAALLLIAESVVARRLVTRLPVSG